MNAVVQKLKTGMLQSVLGKFLIYIIQFILMMLYARVFTPEQFGVFAAIQVFVLFFQMLGEIGLGPALINQECISPRERNGVFTVTALIGIVVAIIFYLFSYFLNSYYARTDYQDYGLLLSIAIFFQSLCTMPLVSFQKQRKFITIALIDSVAEIISAIVVLYLAYLGKPLYALASRPLVVAINKFLIMNFFAKNTAIGSCQFGKNIAAVKPLLAFSSYQFAFNFINYFSRNLDNILVAKYMGAISLGVYDKAYQLMRYPLMLLTFAMTPAIQPVISEHRGDVKMVLAIHNEFVKKMSLLGVVVGFAMYIFASPIVTILLGNQWLKVIPILEILAIIIPIQIVLSTSGSFFQAMDRADLLFASGLASAIVNVAAIITGIYIGTLEAICWGLVVSFSINFIQAYWVMYKYVYRVNFFVFYRSIIKSLILIISLLASLWLFKIMNAQ